MKIKSSFRLEKTNDDAIEKIRIKESITKTDAVNNILKLGLEAYFNKNETEKFEKKLEPKFDEIQKKFEFLSGQMKDLSTQTLGVDLKSYRMNIFLTDFAEAFFDDDDKFNLLKERTTKEVIKYRSHIKYAPKFGIIVLSYLKAILMRDIPSRFYSEIEAAYSVMAEKKKSEK
jgi:hypothetical protein